MQQAYLKSVGVGPFVASLMSVSACSTGPAPPPPPRSENEPTAVTQFRGFCRGPQSGSAAFEGSADMLTSARQAKASGKPGSIALVMLSRSPNSRGNELWEYPAGLPDEIAARDQQVHAEGRRKWMRGFVMSDS